MAETFKDGDEQNERLALISEREVLEGLSRVDLRAVKVDALRGISERERIVRLVNDILDNGYADEGSSFGVYDANDGTPGSPERPGDSIWPH